MVIIYANMVVVMYTVQSHHETSKLSVPSKLYLSKS